MGRRAQGGASAEDRLIARHFQPVARHPGALDLADDAAMLSPPVGHSLVLTADAVVGGVHFFNDDPPDAIARKALRVNLSDLAAKGAKPQGFLMTLALPKAFGDAWLTRFVRGLAMDAKQYGCPLLGGDTVRTPGPATISITAFGSVPKRTMVRRAGARAGDHILVTGTIGDAALGVRLRKNGGLAKRWRLSATMRRHLAARYLLPQPRNALAEAVRRHASAAMDVSDGLAGDLGKLLRVSGAGATVSIGQVPLSPAARAAVAASPDTIEAILTGGDDFEIVATIPPPRLKSFLGAARDAGVPVTDIGRVTREPGTRFIGKGGRVMKFARTSFSHF